VPPKKKKKVKKEEVWSPGVILKRRKTFPESPSADFSCLIGCNCSLFSQQTALVLHSL
jgi:hypothetical protein